MLQPLSNLIAQPASLHVRNWTAIPPYLKAKVEAGGSRSSHTKLGSAVTGLLRAVSLDPQHAPLDLGWFDRTFPPGGWDPTSMDITKATYDDYRPRVRRLIERMLGASTPAVVVPSIPDGWDDAVAAIEAAMGALGHSYVTQRMIPIRSTLVPAARRAGIRAADLTQPALQSLHDGACSKPRGSIRTAARTISELQAAEPAVMRRLPHPIVPIVAEGSPRYRVPDRLRDEIEHLVELASRRRFIRIKGVHEHVKDGTRTAFRTALHAVVDALIATEHLDPDAGALAPVLSDPGAIEDVARHIVGRVEEGRITARYATTLMGRLPTILERNDIDAAPLRELIAETDELRDYGGDGGMPEHARRLCRRLIEKRSFRNRFLLSHAEPRRVAQDVLDVARAQGRSPTPAERRSVIRHGVVALFCAIEVGGAPVRVRNVIEMPYGSADAWLRAKGRGYAVNIPGAHTKNCRPIEFEMQPNQHGWCDTVRWYLARVRPLILADPEDDEVRASPWLVPMTSDPSRPCAYETFLAWFVRIMRDLVGVPCTPHNFRHGQASLLYHRHPDRVGWIAQRLGDTEQTVLQHYAWLHAEQVMAEGQRLITGLVET